MDWTGLYRTGLDLAGLVWTGLDWVGLGCRIATHRGRYTTVVAVYPHYRLISNIRNSNFQALHRSTHRVQFLVAFHSPPIATVAMEDVRLDVREIEGLPSLPAGYSITNWMR